VTVNATTAPSMRANAFRDPLRLTALRCFTPRPLPHPSNILSQAGSCRLVRAEMKIIQMVISTLPAVGKEKAKRWDGNTKECLRADIGSIARVLYTAADSIGYYIATQLAP